MPNTKRELTCVVCPVGCHIEVELDESGAVVAVEGNTCDRGYEYAVQETTHPMRTLTAIVYVPGALEPLSVKSAAPIPKELLRDAAAQIAALEIELPVRCGDVLTDNLCGSGIAAIATKTLV